MKIAKIILLIATIGCSRSLASPSAIFQHPTGHIVVTSGRMTEPLLAARIFQWLDELINGARKVDYPRGGNLPDGAYRYTQQEDRRRGEHGPLYYLAMAVWRLAAGLAAATIVGKAVEKQSVSVRTKNIAFVVPLVVGLVWPLVALFGSGIVWLACKEEKTEPSAKG